MTVGIYKITNKINGHCYIGQSTQIEKRWSNHKVAAYNSESKSYNYPLYRSFRKYGVENFSFEIIEECSNELLNEKEKYWIDFYSPEYNQTIGGDYKTVPQKLTEEQVKEIQQILLADINGVVSYSELAKTYNVEKYTIQDINSGRTWHNNDYNYPLHLSKFDNRRIAPKFYCIDCGVEISKNSQRCVSCYNKMKRESLENIPVGREELKKMIRNQSFLSIGNQFGVTDNAIRKWCDKFNLPRKKKDIQNISDEDWINI